jgi:hypothetical protein
METKYRFLKLDETIQDGDEHYDGYNNKWNPAIRSGATVTQFDVDRYRRPIKEPEKSTMDQDLDELQSLTRTIYSLLADRQPGIYSWNAALVSNLAELKAFTDRVVK